MRTLVLGGLLLIDEAVVGYVKAIVRWATGERLTNRLPKPSLITLSPPFEQRDSWSSYGAVRAYSEVLL